MRVYTTRGFESKAVEQTIARYKSQHEATWDALMPHQQLEVEFLLRRHELNGHALLGSEMGVGKTPVALVFASIIGARPILIIVPNGLLKQQWRRERQNWCGQDSYLIQSSKDTPPPDASAVIVSYQVLTNQIKQGSKWPRQRWGGLIIIDEMHRTKSPQAQRSKAVISLRAGRKIGLTGTPLLNAPTELYTIALQLDPDVLGLNRKRFEIAFASTEYRTRFNKYSLASLRRTGADVSRMEMPAYSSYQLERRPARSHHAVHYSSSQRPRPSATTQGT